MSGSIPSKLIPFHSPINPALYPLLSILLCSTGFLALAWYFVYVATTRTAKRSLFYELAIALVSSALLGFGVLFLLLWTGIYV